MMDSITSILLSIVAAMIFAAGGWLGKNALLRFRLRHIHYLLEGSDKIKVIFPTFFSPSFADGSPAKGASIPKNNLLMPLAEGRAISDITKAISLVAPKCDIVLQSPDEFTDDGTPFITIGGPSVNSISAAIITEHWREFNLVYPEHYAIDGGVTYKPIVRDGLLVNDFGFLFQTRLITGTKSIVCCGVWAIGTELAVKVYLNVLKLKGSGDLRKKVQSGKNVLLVSEGKVNRIWAGQPTIIGWREA